MTLPRNISIAANELRFSIGESSLGAVLVASSHKGIRAILFGSSHDWLVRELRTACPEATLLCVDATDNDALGQVVQLVESPRRGLDLPLDIEGTDFERRVWQAVREIPPGATASYGDIAKRVGDPRGAREVAEACAANKLAVAIPCHRVVKADGSLSGYRWGARRKTALLAREGATMVATNFEVKL